MTLPDRIEAATGERKPWDEPAFPVSDYGAFQYPGMTLRDWFAGQAMISIGTWMPEHGGGNLSTSNAMKARALWAYEQADAMLAEREKTK